MPYADPLEVRRLAGGREESLPESSVTRAIERSDARVNLWTGKYDWTAADPDYNVVREISELLASSSIRKAYDDNSDEADEQEAQATALFEKLLASPHLTEDDKQHVLIESRPYGSNPANPSALPYSSRRGGTAHYDSDLDVEGIRSLEY